WAGRRWRLSFGGLGALLISFAGVLMLYPWFLLGEFVLGTGIAILQVTANPYTLLLGTQESATSRLTLAQAFTSVGTVLAPFAGSVFMLSLLLAPSAFELQGQGFSLQFLYLSLTFLWSGVLVLTYLFALPEGREPLLPGREGGWFAPLKERFVVMGVLGISISTGVEVTIGSHLVKFLADVDIMGVSLSAAGKFMVLFWLGFLLGRFLGSRILKKVAPEKVLLTQAMAGIVFTLFTVIFSGYLAALSVLVLGVCISVLFPVIFSVVLGGCRSNQSAVSGFLCMANIGGALLPLMQGMLADRFGVHRSFVLPLAPFLYIAYYSLYLRNRAAIAKDLVL
ncbi:MAG: MFS transporter, partial [Waddliaceae bacterium]